MSELYHHVFMPWTINGERRFVSPASEWDRIAKFRADERVLVGVDLFEDWGRQDFDGDETKWHIYPPAWTKTGHTQRLADKGRVTVPEFRNRFFDVIAHSPATWIVMTRHTGRVAEMMRPAYSRGDVTRFAKDSARHNLWLGAGPIFTQAEADSMRPGLLEAAAGLRFVWCRPKEYIDLSQYLYGRSLAVFERPVALVVVEAEPKKPQYYAHIESLRQQAASAKVAFTVG